ncbi:helicase-associated domain-containing protein [Deinococcus altitudinis]|uniref:helicase-associated domain-containing protein n=1 Tax=Deinococcus altitudinis TaxID=468914 RepID=UPI0038924074
MTRPNSAAQGVGETGPQGAQTGVRLDPLMERMAAPQLIRMAARYAPGDDARQMQKARDAVSRALGSARNLRALVASLSPLERFLLAEVRRSPGGVDGWALIASARARGLKPAPKPAPVELYRHFRPATFEGADLIWPLLADGLLIPATLPNPFMEGYGRSLESGSPLLTADERLLPYLPEPGERPPLQLKLPPVSAAPQPTSPQLVMLRLLEVLRALKREGGLPLTKQGEYNRNAFKRVQKRLPALPDAEFWIEVAQLGGLLDGQGEVLRPSAGSARLASSDPREVIRGLGRLYVNLGSDHEPAGQAVAYLEPLRSSLLGLLAQLPPTTLAGLQDAFEASTPAILRQPSWRGQGVQWRVWLAEALRGPLRTLGLVALAGEGDEQTVAPAEALRDDAGGVRPAPGPLPAWVVQPNFELVVYPAQLNPEGMELLAAAEALRFDDHSATYRLTRESVYGALEDGLTLEALLAGLEWFSATPLPPGVRSTLSGWAARRERLVLHNGVTLLEFPDAAARDGYQGRSGGTPIAQTLLLPAPGQKLPVGLPVLRYDGPPRKALTVSPAGLITVQGELDFLGRRLLSQCTQAVPGGYRLTPGQSLPASTVAELEARVQGNLPPLLKLQLGRWSGTEPAPALGSATLLQHPQAAALLEHPGLAPHLGGLLAPGLLLVKAGQQGALERELSALGLTPDGEFSAQPQNAGKTAPDYEFPEDTRRKRILLEQAITEGRDARLMYQTETYHGWYGESRPGKTRQRLLTPREIYKEGSTPYLLADVVGEQEEERIRVGYVLGIALV